MWSGAFGAGADDLARFEIGDLGVGEAEDAAQHVVVVLAEERCGRVQPVVDAREAEREAGSGVTAERRMVDVFVEAARHELRGPAQDARIAPTRRWHAFGDETLDGGVEVARRSPLCE